jgi:hypothetical protein
MLKKAQKRLQLPIPRSIVTIEFGYRSINMGSHLRPYFYSDD